MLSIIKHNVIKEEQSDSNPSNSIKDPQLYHNIPKPKIEETIVKLEQGQSKIQEPQYEHILSQEPLLKIQQPSGSLEEESSSYKTHIIEKYNPSAFHNFQKNLIICLKHAIDIQPRKVYQQEYQTLGEKLWKYFKKSSISSKRILHYLLGQNNEHRITEVGLKQLGLNTIYEANDDKTLREARIYLAKQTLQQIKKGKLQSYINGKKVKNKDKFKKYVYIFMKQLQSGYLKKRLSKNQVKYLLLA